MHSISYCFFAISSASAQITPDTSLPIRSAVFQAGNVTTISGGTKAGVNLFHSFEEFNIPTSTEAVFNNPADIQNIITRVTGSKPSQIDGLIATASKTNLFLINPSGIVFGDNARLDIGGSFLASSALNIKFADGVIYSVRPSQNAELLSVTAPIGLGFGGNNGTISVQGRGHDLSGTPFNRKNYTSGLKVEPGQTLALVGGKINLDGGILTAPQGSVELGSINDQGYLSINPSTFGFGLSYPENLKFDNIELSNKSLIDVNGTYSGFVQLYGRHVNFKDGSLVWLQNRGVDSLSLPKAGYINVFASDSLQLTGTTLNRIPSGLVNETIASGASRDINVTTQQLNIRNGAILAANTYSSGAGGNINITAQSINVLEYFPNDTRAISTLSALAHSQGNAGNLNLFAQSVSVTGGGFVGSVTTNSGASGNVNIKAENILVSGSAPAGDTSSIISSSWRNGNPGKVNIDTTRLKVSSGGLISSSSFSNSSAGNVTINADTIEVEGKSGSTTSQIRSAVRIFGAELKNTNQAANIRQQLQLPDIPQGNAGDVNINARNLFINNEARISVQNQGIGKGGTLKLNVGSLVINNKSSITANTTSGIGGEIYIKAEDIRLRNNSNITATSQGLTGSGGNININTQTLLASENSDIFANAEASFAGRITINATGIFGTEFRSQLTPQSDVTASSEQGSSFNGVVSINSLNHNPNVTVIKLPSTIIQAANQINIGCPASAGDKFIVVGRGGLPENPTDALRGETIWSDLRPQREETKTRISMTRSMQNAPPTIVEATGWVKDASGKVELVARFPRQENPVTFNCLSNINY
ncbi:MAG: filamentous hemagglutinin N-terminal domain-containing protein [Calothrix sp. C42_A2020_038]|nr:filamentous hemagglutinin N-terminal domain-containing protein [Calothrix sp. C42_A2020_038]